MIPGQLLQTKLQTPRRRPSVVARSRLIDILKGALECKLILVSAPAGFGKTTLLTEWLADCQYPSAWLTLDEHDNGLARFMAYLFAALQNVKTGPSEADAGLFNPPQLFTLTSAVTGLLNEVNSISSHFILVVDDCHVIKAQSVHKVLSSLIDNLPANMHLVIVGRADPPINLARLRGRGQLTELRADDLRFTSEEVAEFLNRVMGLDLNGEELATLDDRTEGWIAGLQMAAISLKGKADTAGFIRALAGSRRNILDYLFEEVFEQQTADVQSFLLQTSVLDRLTPSLCDAVRERTDSDQILDKIERANLFVFPLDAELRWYRYHGLLRDLLRHGLSIRHPETIPTLHRRASEWYERQDLWPLAISHALEAKDFDRAAHLIETRASEIMTHGEYATYLGWMDSFPDSVIEMYPILIVHRLLAETVAMGLPLASVEARLQEVAKLDPKNGLVKGAAIIVREVALGNQGDLSQNHGLSEEALKLIPPEATLWHGLGVLGLKQYWLMEGGVPDIPTATGLYPEAMETGQRVGNLFVALLAQRRLAEAYVAAGRLRLAHGHYQRIVDCALDRHGQPLSIACFGLFGLGMLHRERNDLEKAQSYLEEGIAEEGGRLGRWQLDGIIELARTRLAMADLDGASRYLQKARQLLAKFPGYGRSHESVISADETGLALARGDMERVASWADALDPAWLAGSFKIGEEISAYVRNYPNLELQALTLARADIALSRPTEALRLLDALATAAERLGRLGILLEANVLFSLAYKALGDNAKAISHLRKALIAAEPEGYVRVFLDEAPAIASLLYEAARNGITPAYAHRLIATLPASDSGPRKPDKSVKMEEPLSERELGVLRLIAIGLSNKEIGERLHIETRTVKWHTSNIFGKMGVKNRIQAVARARELGIIKADPGPPANTY